MQVKCEYCDSYYDDDEEKCPYCGATNENLNRTAKGEPRTIEELKEYCIRHNIPTDTMHVYIGENYTGPKAYGIYQDGENFIVYKNKADGSRAIRYDGMDESYAVNELYQKIRERIINQAEKNPKFRKEDTSPYEYDDRPTRRFRRRRRSRNMWVFIILLLAFLALAMSSGRPRFTYTESGYEFYWDTYDYDDYDYDNDYDDYGYDDNDWDDDWDDYDYDWDDYDDSWDSDW